MHRYSALMQHTIDIARKATQTGQLPFAAILVRDDRVLAEATNSVLATGDVTRHATINLACAAQQQFSRKVHDLLQLRTLPYVCRPDLLAGDHKCGVWWQRQGIAANLWAIY